MVAKNGRMQVREFIFYVEDLATAALPPDVPKPQRKMMWTILQLFWDNPRAHFELQPQPSRQLVELGLHFEGPAADNERWAQRLAGNAPELQAALGPAWELEEWTASWRRLHRTFPYETLTGELGREVASELAKAVTLLWPYALVGPTPEKPAAANHRPYHERFRRHARV